jgi:hypothetical protein
LAHRRSSQACRHHCAGAGDLPLCFSPSDLRWTVKIRT